MYTYGVKSSLSVVSWIRSMQCIQEGFLIPYSPPPSWSWISGPATYLGPCCFEGNILLTRPYFLIYFFFIKWWYFLWLFQIFLKSLLLSPTSVSLSTFRFSSSLAWILWGSTKYVLLSSIAPCKSILHIALNVQLKVLISLYSVSLFSASPLSWDKIKFLNMAYSIYNPNPLYSSF